MITCAYNATHADQYEAKDINASFLLMKTARPITAMQRNI
jgi:hypothetical protein